MMISSNYLYDVLLKNKSKLQMENKVKAKAAMHILIYYFL